MNKFTIVCKSDQNSVDTAKRLQSDLRSFGWVFDDKDPELVIVVGGDGSFLSAVHKYQGQLDKVCFTGLHTGTLGFLSEYKKDEYDQLVTDLTTKTPRIEEKRLLRIDLKKGDKVDSYLAVNEARFESYRTQAIEVLIDHNHLENYRGSGLCISTQTGSTAYNRSLKGAVIQSGLELIELTEVIGVHHSECRSLGVPIILSGDSKITLKSNAFKGVNFCFDRYVIEMDSYEEIDCYLSNFRMRTIHYRDVDWTKSVEQLF